MKKSSKKLKFLLATRQLSDARSAGYSLSDARSAGYSLSDAISAGYSLSDAEFERIPILKNPYTKLWNDIKEKKIKHQQSTFGKIETFDQFCENEKANNICNTPMCTAGNLVLQIAQAGFGDIYDYVGRLGWDITATLIHLRAHADFPVQDFSAIPQDQAMTYIEVAANFEKTGKIDLED